MGVMAEKVTPMSVKLQASVMAVGDGEAVNVSAFCSAVGVSRKTFYKWVARYRAEGLDVHLGWQFADGTTTGLHVRNQVAVPTDGENPDHSVALSLETWADLLAGKPTLTAAFESEAVTITGDIAAVREAWACFDHPSLAH